jgi:hypothetical protein
VTESPLYKAHCEIFKRYIAILKEADPGDRGDKTSPGHLISLCEQAIKRPDAPDDKVSRWLGFVQGVMAVKGLISVDEERDLTRPLFHRAYEEMGIENPPSITA